MAATSINTVLITGGAGFIGSHLCDRMVQKGNRVICVDNLQTGHIDNIRPLMNHPSFRFIEHDVRDALDFAEPLDQIYNLACPASPQHYQRDPIATIHTCVTGAYNVLELARRKDARVLQASTSEVYGDPEIHPQPETYLGNVNPIGPRACYDEGKRCAETLFFEYQRKFGVQVKVARIFNTYGPRMQENDGRVVSNFIVQALRDEPLTLFGDGAQTRSLCYIDDLVNGLELLMASDGRISGPCNLGKDTETSVQKIAEFVLKETGSKSNIVCKPLPVDDPRRRQPVIDRAFDLLGWRPTVELDEGLRQTIDYFALKLFTRREAHAPARMKRKKELFTAPHAAE